MKKHFTSAGFTIVEMAIVLVIIGLIIAGVITGKDLIQSSKLDSIASDMQRYEGAVVMFKKKYMALPGDMPDAANSGSITGVLEGGVPVNGHYVDYGDGDGDGIIDNDVEANGTTERYLTWRHLALAGFIKGTYSGYDSNDASLTGHTVAAPALGKDIPAGPFKNSGYMIYTPLDTNNNYITSEQVVSYGSTNGGGPIAGSSAGLQQGDVTGGVITASQAQMIDKKLDDGQPHTGKFQIDNSFYYDIAGGHSCLLKAGILCNSSIYSSSHAGAGPADCGSDATYNVSEGYTMCHPFYIINNR